MEFEHGVNRLQAKLEALLHRKQQLLQSLDNDCYTEDTAAVVPWWWVALGLAQCLKMYPSGVTETIALSDLEAKWERASTRFKKGYEHAFGALLDVYNGERDVLLEATVEFCAPIPRTHIYTLTIMQHNEHGVDVADMLAHPKFNILLSEARSQDRPFMEKRKIRMVSSPLLNAPVRQLRGDKELPRHISVARIAATDLLLFVLTAADVNYVKKEFNDTLRTTIPPGFMGFSTTKVHKLWLRITHIESRVHVDNKYTLNRGGQDPKFERTDIYVVDLGQDDAPAILSLYDEQMKLAHLLRRGDYIGLYHPSFPVAQTESQKKGSDIIFEYGDKTVLFTMSEEEASKAGIVRSFNDSKSASQLAPDSSPMTEFLWEERRKESKRDEDGLLDCAKIYKRILIRDLEPGMLNVTILGRIVALRENNPYVLEDGRTHMDRFAVRIMDSTGRIDVTLWDEAGRNIRNMRVGQVVLLAGLTTSKIYTHSKGTIWYVNGSPVSGTEIINVSSLKAMLTSSNLRRVTSIRDISDGPGNWQVAAMIVAWRLRARDAGVNAFRDSNFNPDGSVRKNSKTIAARVVFPAHAACLQPVTKVERQRHCRFCRTSFRKKDEVPVFRNRPHQTENKSEKAEEWIEWVLDDGSGKTLTAYGYEETLLSVSAAQFQHMSYNAQVGLLDSVVGKQFYCAVSRTSQDCCRIDQVAPLHPTSGNELMRCLHQGPKLEDDIGKAIEQLHS
ncbi:hypothetical protein BCR43DRAFT_95242 [Syncephalastrum racemosum]|uniref:Replication protein A OB domain-containing protein n=1 Tax=Syncephalastrum racemosum TaxID=13706 RepID=A0A1X2H0W3_SYNRA|nr:hypothetical protein BCR43DRAFT_95242 [Syncephalastrum racemosum]